MRVSVDLWYTALASPFGLILQCEDNPETIRQKLYRLRVESKDPDLDCLSIAFSPTSKTDLWIFKKAP